MSGCFFIGVDVGTGSARAGIFNYIGEMISSSSHPIKMWKEGNCFVEQSSDDIWNAVCIAVRDAKKQAKISKNSIKGIGFDATCSLVAVDRKGLPISVSLSNDKQRNIIVWMDHRALEETEFINSTGHSVLSYVGGKISPEMQIPKLLWIKKNKPQCWKDADLFFDLPDFLTYKATGSITRSVCSTVCKWTYLAHKADSGNGWDKSFFDLVGLSELSNNNFEKIGSDILPLGNAVGNGLTEKSAAELGLLTGTPVGTSIIDAHAGGIGMLGTNLKDTETIIDFDKRIALIGGTSSCHMAVSKTKNYIPGVWGPYYNAMIPEYWLSEGGQSATGALVDHIIFSHSYSTQLKKTAEECGTNVYDVLNNKIYEMGLKLKSYSFLTKDLHVLPYFHGNRSPRANPNLKGAVAGLQLSSSLDDLALLYLATIQSIAYGTRHIIETMNEHGFAIDTIFACGGGIKNPIFIKEHADITGCKVVIPKESEAVLLGAAILGAVSSGLYSSVTEGMKKMSRHSKIIESNSGEVKKYHDRKYMVFKEMYNDFIKYDKIMIS